MKKNRCFEVPSSLTVHSNEPFLDQVVTCHERWIIYTTTSSVAGPRRSFKALAKAKLGPEMFMVAVRWCAGGLIL